MASDSFVGRYLLAFAKQSGFIRAAFHTVKDFPKNMYRLGYKDNFKGTQSVAERESGTKSEFSNSENNDSKIFKLFIATPVNAPSIPLLSKLSLFTQLFTFQHPQSLHHNLKLCKYINQSIGSLCN